MEPGSWTISLGVYAVNLLRGLTAVRGAMSVRDKPFDTGVNGTLMARRTVVGPALIPVPRSSPSLKAASPWVWPQFPGFEATA